MNNLRRKELQKVVDQIEGAYWGLETLRDEEEVYRDNIPENLQNSQNYEKSKNAVSNLDDALGNLSDAMDFIMSAIE